MLVMLVMLVMLRNEPPASPPQPPSGPFAEPNIEGNMRNPSPTGTDLNIESGRGERMAWPWGL